MHFIPCTPQRLTSIGADAMRLVLDHWRRVDIALEVNAMRLVPVVAQHVYVRGAMPGMLGVRGDISCLGDALGRAPSST
jgi:hypothetical protein